MEIKVTRSGRDFIVTLLSPLYDNGRYCIPVGTWAEVEQQFARHGLPVPAEVL